MAIISKSGKRTHEGCVIKMERKDFRAMSDVYTVAEYALVWLPEEERVEWQRINILYMGCNNHCKIEVDIHSGEYAEDYEIFLFLQEEREKAFQKAKDEKMFKEALHTVQKGRNCRVIKGRKVPKGTEGNIFYIRHDRIGFKDTEGVAYWVNADQVEVKYKEWGFKPADSWKAEYKRFCAEEQAIRDRQEALLRNRGSQAACY
jgi:hypothetical protein